MYLRMEYYRWHSYSVPTMCVLLRSCTSRSVLLRSCTRITMNKMAYRIIFAKKKGTLVSCLGLDSDGRMLDRDLTIEEAGWGRRVLSASSSLAIRWIRPATTSSWPDTGGRKKEVVSSWLRMAHRGSRRGRARSVCS
jgi:hypothetical protein